MYDFIVILIWCVSVGVVFRTAQWAVSHLFELYKNDYECMRTVLTPLGTKFWVIPAIFFPMTVYCIRYHKYAWGTDGEDALDAQNIFNWEHNLVVIILGPVVVGWTLYHHYVVLRDSLMVGELHLCE